MVKFMDIETGEYKGIILGFTVSIITSVIAMYIYYDYIATRAAKKAIEDYKREFEIMGSSQQKLSDWKPLSINEIREIKNHINNSSTFQIIKEP